MIRLGNKTTETEIENLMRVKQVTGRRYQGQWQDRIRTETKIKVHYETTVTYRGKRKL